MKRIKGTDRKISGLVTETLSHIREEMEAAGNKVHHYSQSIDAFDTSMLFDDGYLVDVRVDRGAQYVWAAICNGLEQRPASEGPTQYLIHFDGRRQVHISGTELFREMTDGEKATWDSMRKARGQRAVKPFSIEEEA